MVTFEEFVRRFYKLKSFIKKRAEQLMVEMNIEEMIIDQQHKGIGSDGQKMQTGYSKGYAKKRKKKGLQVRYVDLHFTGKMHKGMKVRPAKGGVDVRSEEPYEYYVRANFPKGFSLTKEQADKVSVLLANKLAPEIKKYLVG